jgi:diguanylate cyclase
MAAFDRRNFWSLPTTGYKRVVALTIVGTLLAIATVVAVDSSPLFDGQWRLGGKSPLRNVFLPAIAAPPILYYLFRKLPQLAILCDQLMVIASTDGLTSCMTRAAFTAMIDASLDRVAEEEARRPGALLMIDVDHFKFVNDRYGHAHGDTALRIIAAAMRASLRDVDLVGRMGGEEFGVFTPGLPPEGVSMVAERMRAAVKAAQFYPDGIRCQLSISVGAATFSSETSFNELYKLADGRLYYAKRNGRDRVELASISSKESPPIALEKCSS